MTFRINQKVVCVHADWGPCFYGGGPTIPPVEGQIYTVVGIEDVSWFHGSTSNGAYLVFAECDDDEMFSARRFRPVKTTSIEVFEHMLRKTPERVRA